MLLVDSLLFFLQVPEVLLLDERLVDVDELPLGRDLLHHLDLLDHFLLDRFPRMRNANHFLFHSVELHLYVILRIFRVVSFFCLVLFCMSFWHFPWVSQSFSPDKFVKVECRVIWLDSVVLEGSDDFGVLIESLDECWCWFGVIELVVDFLELVLARGFLGLVVFVVKVVKIVSILKVDLISVLILVVEDDSFEGFL